MIKRTITNIVDELILHTPVTLLTGPRQVGKTTLLTHLLKNKLFHYLSLDDVTILMDAKADPLAFLNAHPCPLIIDEAQKAPELFVHINTLVNKVKVTKGNEKANTMYILSGSSKQSLIEQAKESLAGRMMILNMHSLSLNEIYKRESVPFSLDKTLLNKRNNVDISEAQIFHHIYRGFLPNLYSDPKVKINIYWESYLQTYIQKDLRQLIDVNNEITFINFIKLLANNIGQELVYDNYARQLRVSAVTIKRWINALAKTGVIYLLQPYNEFSYTKRVTKRPKLYFFDTGLVAHLTGIDNAKTLSNSFLKGRFFENFVINEIKKSFENDGQNIDLYYYRDARQHEIDLIYVKNASLHLIEIKCGTQFSLKDVDSFKQITKSKYPIATKAIICSGDKLYSLDKDTMVIPARAI